MVPIVVLCIFIISYILLITETWDRMLVAGAGGVAMLIVGAFTIHDALFTYIDWKTIALLFAMMLIVSITSQTGFFEYIAIRLAQMVRGDGILLLILFFLLSAVGSAFLANVTVAMLIVPILFTLTRLLQLPPIPYMIATILSCNIGGTATLIGDPPNMMIGQTVQHLTFNAFLQNLLPVVLLIMFITILLIAVLYREQLYVKREKQLLLAGIRAANYLKKEKGLYPSIIVLGMVMLGFMLYPLLHLDVTTVALAGAVLLLLLLQRVYQPEEVLKQVEWGTIFFFIGLFLIVGGLEEAGFIDELARSIIRITEGDMVKTSLFILWSTGILSAFIDNIPFVAAMIPVLQEFQEIGIMHMDPLWWSLALGACLGGNGTLLGSSSNLVIAGLAAREQAPVSFREYLWIGMPIMFLSLIISTIYVYVRYLLPFM
jgi:Na+/H+ antiporter NhaD/arsenite permease-like protein